MTHFLAFFSRQSLHQASRLLLAVSVTSVIAGVIGANGKADGPALQATFWGPAGLVVDPGSGDVWMADAMNCLIRVLRAATNIVSTISGSVCGGSPGPLATATLGTLAGITLDSTRGDLYVTQPSGHVILKVSPAAGTVTVVAGKYNTSGYSADGPASSSLLTGPTGIAMGPDGASVYWTEVSAGMLWMEFFRCGCRSHK